MKPGALQNLRQVQASVNRFKSLESNRRTARRAVVETFLEAISPAGLEAAIAAQDLGETQDQAALKQFRLQVERAGYEAEQAERRYRAVEPENRLVARTLETECLVTGPLFGGMSGVVYGLFGYIWMRSKIDGKTRYALHPNTVIILFAWFFICLLNVFPGFHVANIAHAVGLGTGIAWGWFRGMKDL